MIIYKHTCTISGKSYIGKSIQSLEDRWDSHCQQNPRKCFQNAIYKYGKDCWTHEILEDNIPLELLNEREIYWISFHDTFNNGYNLTKGGDGGDTNTGKHWSEEHKNKIRLANLGKKYSEETKEKHRQTRLGKHHTEEVKEKMRQKGLGNKNAIGNKSRKDQIPWNKGKAWSEEVKQKMRKPKTKKELCNGNSN